MSSRPPPDHLAPIASLCRQDTAAVIVEQLSCDPLTALHVPAAEQQTSACGGFGSIAASLRNAALEERGSVALSKKNLSPLSPTDR